MKRILLNGVWEFGFAADDGRIVYDSLSSVPGCFDTRSGEFGKRQRAGFKRQVTVSGGDLMLTLDACGLHTQVCWDGVCLASDDLPYSRQEIIVRNAAAGEHTLEIITDNFLTGDPAEQFKSFYDFYGYGGIYGDVSLTEFSPGDLRKVEVIPLDYRDGSVEIRTEAFDETPEYLHISFDGKEFSKMPYQEKFVCQVPSFKVWSVEEPNLHTMNINGTEAVFGIRTIDYSGKELKLNGKPLKLIGCNRHEAHPESGPATGNALTLNDLLMIKQQGFNFIRGSHYPQKEFMLDMCDKLGLLVWEEALAWGNKAEEFECEKFVARQQEACRRMVKKSINHPSVIIWGFLNECASDQECVRDTIASLRSEIRQLDISRPAAFASNRPDLDISFDHSDIIAINIYPGWYDTPDTPVDGIDRVKPTLKKYAEKFADINKPLIVSEIGAAALRGDHSGYRWSEDYQSRLLTAVLDGIFEFERYTGTALWLFCDTKSYLETGFSFTRPRGFNNKGMLDEYRRPKMAWHDVHKFLKNKGF